MEGDRDPRRTYILRLASAVFGLKIEEEKLRQTTALEKFCDTNITILVVLRNEVTIMCIILLMLNFRKACN